MEYFMNFACVATRDLGEHFVCGHIGNWIKLKSCIKMQIYFWYLVPNLNMPFFDSGFLNF